VAIRLPAAFLGSVALLVLSATATYADTSGLYSRLAPAPAADWVEAAAGPTTLEGPFDSHSYDAYLHSVSPTTPSVEKQLNSLAFRAGYGRMWVQGPSRDVLVERVFQFGDNLGASAWYANLKTQNQFTKYMVRVLPPLEGHPDSFGVVLKTPNYNSYRVEFVIDNLVFTVHMDSAQNDLTSLAVTQALAELNPPAASQSPANHHSAVRLVPSGGFAVAALLFTLVAGALLLAAVARRRRRSIPPV